MTLTQILEDEKTTSGEKLTKVTEIVTAARKEYGNTEAEITAPKVATTDGHVDMKYLSDDDKLVYAKKAIRKVIASVIATTDCTEGTVFDREFERLAAIDPVLVNLATTSGSKYL